MESFKVFSFKVDINKYQLVLPVKRTNDLLKKLDFDGTPKLENWDPIEFYIDNPKKKKTDFFSFVTSSAFACTPNIVNSFLKFWDLSSELLPIFLDDGTELFIVNIIECVNALNKKETIFDQYDDGSFSNNILKYSFYKERLHESSIFKIPESRSMLTYSGLKSKNDEFYYKYLESYIEGLVFEEIYSD